MGDSGSKELKVGWARTGAEVAECRWDDPTSTPMYVGVRAEDTGEDGKPIEAELQAGDGQSKDLHQKEDEKAV